MISSPVIVAVPDAACMVKVPVAPVKVVAPDPEVFVKSEPLVRLSVMFSLAPSEFKDIFYVASLVMVSEVRVSVPAPE